MGACGDVSAVVHAFVPLPAAGRTVSSARAVRLGDVSPRGRLRLDALACYLQDVANDDARSSGIADPDGWVVRRTAFLIDRHAVLAETVTLTTFCSGIGPRWAERRTVIRGDRGAVAEAVSLWVAVDAGTGRPRRLDADFAAVYGPSAGGRTVSARLVHQDPTRDPRDDRGEDPAPGLPFPLRFADFDPFGHVNNAVHWAMLEEVLAGEVLAGGSSLLVELEYRRAIERDAEVSLVVSRTGEGAMVWITDGLGPAASARVVFGGGQVNR